MMLLPKKVGSFTLMRKLGVDAMTERYVAILDEPAGKQIVARRVHPAVHADPSLANRLRSRVADLQAVRHPTIVPVLDLVEVDGELYVLEDWVDAVDLGTIIEHCQAQGGLPHNVFLDLATQICNSLEALHGRPGAQTGVENVLHQALSPSAVLVTANGKVRLTQLGLVHSPTAVPQSAQNAAFSQIEYLSPEQTHPDQPQGPASDIFALGSLLYELLTLRPAFKADSNLQTIHRIRRAEITTQLLEVKEILPGLDRVLYRALALNPRHRYQRAFVLREDLRGLMAGFSFADIEHDARLALAPMFGARSASLDEVIPPIDADRPQESTAALLQAAHTDTDPGPTSAPGGELRPAWGDPDDTTAVRRGRVDDTMGVLRAAMADGDGLGIDHDEMVPEANTPVPQPLDGPARPVPSEVSTAAPSPSPGGDPEPTGPTSPQSGLPELPPEMVDAPPLASRPPESQLPVAPLDSFDHAEPVPLSALQTQERPSPVGPPPSAIPTREEPEPLDPDLINARTVPQTGLAEVPRGAPLEPSLANADTHIKGDGGPLDPDLAHADTHIRGDGGPLDPALANADTHIRPDDVPPLDPQLDFAHTKPQNGLPDTPPPQKRVRETPPPAVRAGDPEQERLATAAAREALAPADSLRPPASEPPARPRTQAPPAPPPPAAVPDPIDDEPLASGGVPWVPIAVMGVVAAVALFACVGLGGAGGLVGVLAQRVDGPGPAPVPVAEAPVPAAAAPAPW